MRILVTTNAAVGHFLPMGATVAELVTAGHDVRIGCPASFAPLVSAAGFTPMACDETDVAPSVPPPPPAGDHQGRLMWAVTWSWPADSRSWVDSLLRQAREWQPDVVVVEPVEHAGRVVAAALGLRLIVHGWGFTLPADIERRSSTGLRDLYRRASARPPAPAFTADLGPRTVQADDIGETRRYRYLPFSLPDAPAPPARDGRPSVLVTLGTYANPRASALLYTTTEAALDNNASTVVVLGNKDRGSSDDFPSAATVLDWVDMPAAVAGCDLVVHHGGAGTSWAALTAGKPALVLPQAGDQFRNAALLRNSGAAAVSYSHRREELAPAIGQALGSTELRQRAEYVARENAALPAVRQLARDIAACAAT